MGLQDKLKLSNYCTYKSIGLSGNIMDKISHHKTQNKPIFTTSVKHPHIKNLGQNTWP